MSTLPANKVFSNSVPPSWLTKNSYNIFILLLLQTVLFTKVSHLSTLNPFYIKRFLKLSSLLSLLCRLVVQHACFRRHQASMGISPLTLYPNGFHSLYALHLCVSLLLPLFLLHLSYSQTREICFGSMPLADSALRLIFCLKRMLTQKS